MVLDILALQNEERRADYFDKLAEEIRTLLIAVHGHALVLFTSYAGMSAVKDRLKQQPLPFPLFTMGRNAPHTMAQFKAAPGSVLFATGAAWEGFDFPGDCVSLLVIPRLPFQYPDALQEKKREAYPDLRTFIRAVAVPEMQIIDEQVDAIRLTIDTIRNGPETLSSFDEILFTKLVERIVVDTQSTIRFQLYGGFEFQETLEA